MDENPFIRLSIASVELPDGTEFEQYVMRMRRTATTVVVDDQDRVLLMWRHEWGGWGSNPRPADYEKYGPALRVRYLHGYHGVVPPIALIALLARVARSTNRSTLYHGDHRMPTTKRYRPPGRSTRTRWRKAARGEPNVLRCRLMLPACPCSRR